MKRTASSAIAAVICGCIGLSSCSRGDDNTLYLFNWTYYTPDSVLRQFEQEYGCTVKVDTFDSNEVMYAKLKAGASGYDITFPSQDYTSIMINQGMLREIDRTNFPNSSHINPAVLQKTTFDPEMRWSVPYYMGAAGIAVNKQKVKEYDRSWDIFSRTDLKGHMTMMDDMREVIGDALAFSGYSVNTTDMTVLKSAADLISSKWKPNLVKFDAEGFGKSFASGDFWVCQGYAEVVYGEVPEDRQADMIDFFIPEEGGPMYIDSMVILKNSKHYDLAMKFIDFIHRPDIYVQFLDNFRFPGFVNPDADSIRKTVPLYRPEEMERCELKLDIGADLEKYNELWQDIRFSAD